MKLKCDLHKRRVHVINHTVYHKDAQLCEAMFVEIGGVLLSRHESKFWPPIVEAKRPSWIDFTRRSKFVDEYIASEKNDAATEKLLRDIFEADTNIDGEFPLHQS